MSLKRKLWFRLPSFNAAFISSCFQWRILRGTMGVQRGPTWCLRASAKSSIRRTRVSQLSSTSSNSVRDARTVLMPSPGAYRWSTLVSYFVFYYNQIFYKSIMWCPLRSKKGFTFTHASVSKEWDPFCFFCFFKWCHIFSLEFCGFLNFWNYSFVFGTQSTSKQVF